MDESALLYRLGPSRTYLTANESRRDTRGTEFQKQKRSISILMCINFDGSHILPTCYIGTATNPHCFCDPRFASLKEDYWGQPNRWMDSNGYRRWINFWYSEVKTISNGPWCLLMGNCGGRELDVTLDGVCIEFLPPRSTMKHQPPDLGLIVSAKIRYHFNLLNCTLDVLQMRRATNQTLRTSSRNGKWGLHDGQLPHVGDAIHIFNNALSCMPCTSVMKCWIKSECMGSVQTGQLQSWLDAIQRDNYVDIDLT